MIKYLIIVVLISLSASCVHKEKPINVVGFYQRQTENLNIKTDGTFEQEHRLISCLSSEIVTCIKGTYLVKDNILKFTPDFWSEEYFEGSYRDLTLVERTVGPFNELSNLFFDSLAIVPWNKKLYLLVMNNIEKQNILYEPFPGEIDEFINYANNNDTTFERPLYWSKECKDCTKKELRSVLPEQWKQNILNVPIGAKIIAVDTLIMKQYRYASYTAVITIDAGADKGVRRGMKFHTSKDEPHVIEIVEVHDDYSKGVALFSKVSKCKLNTVMTTYYKRDTSYME